MRAIRFHELGGPEVLRLDEIAVPEPGPGEVRIAVDYAGVNFIDVYMRTGVFRKSITYKNTPPFTPGMEGGGWVAGLGPGVEGLKEGDAVAYCLELGSYAEYAVVPAWKLVKVPKDVPMDVATALQLQGMTAHYLTDSLFPLKPGHACLVQAGAGGLGQFVIQLAKAKGAVVFATVGSAEKAAVAKARGADHVILYREVDFAEAVLDITGGLGVDVVYDSVGKDTYRGSLRCLKPRGVLSNNGNASGRVQALDPLDLAEAGSVFFTRPHLADYIPTAAERARRSGDLYRLYRDGKLVVTIDREFPLAEAKAAHDYIEARKTKGKLILHVTDA